jgi:transposase
MQAIATVGLDIAKSVFQVHGVDAQGCNVVRRQLKRRYVLAFFNKLPPCLVGIEACAASHHWSRELQALGHTVRLIPPAYVKPHVKRQNNDAADAEAICEAVQRPSMRFVPTKTPEQQSCLVLLRTLLLIRSRLLSSTRSAHISPSSALSLRLDATAWSNCSMLSPTTRTSASPTLRASVSRRRGDIERDLAGNGVMKQLEGADST